PFCGPRELLNTGRRLVPPTESLNRGPRLAAPIVGRCCVVPNVGRCPAAPVWLGLAPLPAFAPRALELNEPRLPMLFPARAPALNEPRASADTAVRLITGLANACCGGTAARAPRE